ncbi:MAG: DUF2752 domain-containing protein [Clostridiales bacterium]|jgi:hypothetical protein|nr:DUF2752 domain-containing protein [Clostridiales bacterium]
MEARADSQKFFDALSRKTWFRIFFGIAVPVVVVGGLSYLYFKGNPFICIFNDLTGLYSPGCGSGRALSAILRCDFAAAFSYNALFTICLPFIAYYFVSAYLKIVTGKYVIPQLKIPLGVYFAVMAAFILFGILRNIPIYPFTLLAP